MTQEQLTIKAIPSDMTSNVGISGLADTVQRLASEITRHLVDTNQAERTFESSFRDFPNSTTYNNLRDQLNNAVNDLLLLVNGPLKFFLDLQLGQFELAAYQVALEFEFFKHVPVQGEIELSDLAHLVGVDQDRVGRVLRLLGTQKVFKEVREDVFAHTPSSALLADTPSLHATLATQMDEMYQAASATTESIRKNPNGATSAITPFSTRFGKSIYEFYKDEPSRATRFGQAMKGSALLDLESLCDLKESFPWESLGIAKVVDVGGGGGHVSQVLAEAFPKLSFIVQDIFIPPSTQHLDGSVVFQQHNFFEDQPIHDANAYFIKHCLHNYGDEDCVKILKAFVPALERNKPGVPLLINEGILENLWVGNRQQQRTLRNGDMCMLVTLSSKERTKKQYEKLLETADSRFKITNIYGASVTKLIEVHLVK